MGSPDLNLDHLRRTEKQKAFGYDFLRDVDRLEYWDGITVGEEHDSARTYEVTKEDLVAFAAGVGQEGDEDRRCRESRTTFSPHRRP